MPVTDTSWLYVLHDEADPRHAKAEKAASTATRLLVPGPTFGEFLALVEHRAHHRLGNTRGEAHRFAQDMARRLVQTPNLRIIPDYDAAGALRLFVRDGKVSYVDAVGIVAADQHREPLLTFDARQARLYRDFQAEPRT
jgi:predicted nucleic acid-binding protein